MTMLGRTFMTLALTAAMATMGTSSGQALLGPRAAVPTCSFKPATIVGTNGADTIAGTPGDDVIVALGGNDTVRSLGGNDTVCLGAGRDIVKGGAGDDTFVTEATVDGSDNFVGNVGLDRVSYGGRTVSIDVSIDADADDGEAGEADKVQLSVEAITGSQAADHLIGSELDNVLDGGSGDDDLRGNVGDDTLRGGQDDDLLIGNAGDDFMFGNNDNDTALAAAVEDGSDFFEGSVGVDTASYVGRAIGVSVSLNNVANDGAPGEGDDIRTDVENVEGGSGNDTLNANQLQSGPNRLSGNFGNDVISVTEPFIVTDIADGGASNDLCFTNSEDVRISCEL
jgi:Ca2+-binding RTX toxin-like protein